MSGCRSTAPRASARCAAAWAANSSAWSNSSRLTARIDAAQAWIVLRQAASVVSRALCLLSNTPRAHSPRAWISSPLVTGPAYAATGDAARVDAASADAGAGPLPLRRRGRLGRGTRRRSEGRRREVAHLGLALQRQLLQPPEGGEVAGEGHDDQAVHGPQQRGADHEGA